MHKPIDSVHKNNTPKSNGSSVLPWSSKVEVDYYFISSRIVSYTILHTHTQSMHENKLLLDM